MALDPKKQLGGAPENINEAFFDAIIRHQIGLLLLSARTRRKVWAILDATEADIADQIRRKLKNVSGLDRPASLRRLQALEKSIKAIRSQAWKDSVEVWREEFFAIAKAEPEFLARSLQTISPVLLETALPSAALLNSIVTSRPFRGRVLSEWSRTIAQADIRRITDQIRIGVTQGETSPDIARRVVGTVRQRGRNGVTQISRRQADSLTRTAIISITNQAKREFYKLNSDIFDEELYVATLDSRTTPICRSLDGKLFPIGEGPIPPIHFNCRSVRVAVLDGQAIGRRPQKPFTKRQLLDEYNRANGTSAATRAALPRGHKTQFDAFARGRVRDLTGTIDAKVSYQQWLTRQPANFQDQVLGVTRARLFRKGNLPLDKFVTRAGDEINLTDLAKLEKEAFIRAGLNPQDF
jgi:SPP1 gp7 family putative phage head morphogenesis protein